MDQILPTWGMVAWAAKLLIAHIVLDFGSWFVEQYSIRAAIVLCKITILVVLARLGYVLCILLSFIGWMLFLELDKGVKIATVGILRMLLILVISRIVFSFDNLPPRKRKKRRVNAIKKRPQLTGTAFPSSQPA
jgi:hypothetical protein